MSKAVIQIIGLLILLCLVACTMRPAPNPVLLFAGDGTSQGDVAAVKTLLERKRVAYSTVSSAQLNAMSEAELRQFRLLIVPGGNFIDMGNSLTPESSARVRSSVEHGLNYLGICAGAFIAGASAPNGLNLASGARFRFYAAEDRGIRKGAVAITGADKITLEQYWEDGPQLTGWGDTVSKYPDGTPATVEGRFGKGFVILTGVHPEAPDSWRKGMAFRTPAEADNAYAATLIDAALNGTALPHF
jgi:glutamine amidotransferase-like uncharacterized protein